MMLKIDRDTIARIAQKCFESVPTIVLGSGASIPHRLPSMGDLSNYLCNNMQPAGTAEETAWKAIKVALGESGNLELALKDKDLPGALLSKIISLTWQCVNEKDKVLLYSATLRKDEFPLGQLLSSMFNSTHTEINIVTTNYDRVAEYACNSNDLLFQTGFAPGYLQKWKTTGQLEFRDGGKRARVVKIWKVHGSLDWFKTDDDRTVGLPIFEFPLKKYNYRPLIITPGINKYERALEDPFRTTIIGADDALKSASAFLCIGFGFRDQHIHPKITERCRESDVPIVVLARSLTDEAKNFLNKNAGKNYMGIEESDKGSKIYTVEYQDGIETTEANLWSLKGFKSLTG